MDDSVQQQAEPKLCGQCFSFFGNPASLGMCSKCYREHESEVLKQAAVQEKAVAVAEAAAHVFPIPASPKQPDAPTPMVSEPTPQTTPTAVSPTLAASSSASPAAESAAAAAASPAADPPEAPKPVQKHPNRCFSCNKKVGLTGFKCRCTYIFCSEHRYSDKHECAYDYKSQQKELLTKANPTVIADKIQRI